MDYKAFVSSTYLDLKAHRAHVIRALEAAGFFVDPMEKWTSDADEPKVLSTKRLDGCHLCVLLIARRRGTVPPGDKLSITQQEYEEARRRGIDVLVYLLDDDAKGWPAGFDELASDGELRRWRADVQQQHTPETFKKSPSTLRIAPALTRWLKGKEPKADAERVKFEQRYHKAVKDKNNHLELFGADIAREAQQLPLSVAYVTLNLQSAGDGTGSTMRSAKALFDELRPEAGRLLIRGDAGMGKSTLFRWATIQAAEFGLMTDGDTSFPYKELERLGYTFQHSIVRDWEDNLPKSWLYHTSFLIRLRDCPQGRIPPPDEFLKLIAKELGTPPENWVVDVLREGRGLILLDGVDEVRGDFRESHLRADLTDLVKAYPQNYFVVSTRPEAVPEEWLKDLDFREARINPMGARDREELIDRWHEAIAEATRSLGEEPARFTKLAESLKARLQENPRLSLLASNPLLCAMICALHERDDEHLPDRESRLCERLCFMLLDERDRRRGVHQAAAPEWYTKLDYEEKKLIVRSIAYHMLVTRQQSIIDRQEAVDKVKERLPRMNQRLPPEVTPREVLETLMSRSGMLREATPPSGKNLGTLDFIHNAFKEFLAAERLVEENADGQLASQAHQQEWLPVILFAAATKTEGFATRMLRKILGDDYRPGREIDRTPEPQALASGLAAPAPSPAASAIGSQGPDSHIVNQSLAQQRLLLALRCLPVALDLDPELRGWLERQLQRMFPPRSLPEAEALAATGELAVPFLKKGGSILEMAATVRALRLIGTETALKTLRSFLDATSWEVLDELAQAMNPLEIPAVQQMVQETSVTYEVYQKQQSIRHQIIDLSPLAGLSGLTTLSLYDTQVSDLSPLAGLSGLTSLYLGGTQVSDLSPLAGLSGLTTLNLIGTQVRDLSPLAGLSGLTTLDLGHTLVSDLSPLAGLSGLTTLYLGLTPVSDLSPLAGLSGLTTLNLGWTPVRDLSPLAGLANLKTLYAGDTSVSAKALAAFRAERERRGLPNVKIEGL